MIQDIQPHILSKEFKKDSSPKEGDYIFCFNNNTLLLKEEGDKLLLPELKDFNTIGSFSYLFDINTVNCFLVSNANPVQQEGLKYIDLNFFRNTAQKEISWSSMLAYNIFTWMEANKFCGVCGSKTNHKDDERALVCSECGNIIYPRISPAVIVAITCGDKILLARNSMKANGRYSLLAGYVDVGETLIETVKREVMEEVGIEVRNIRYYESQPWPLSGSLMIGFIAEADCNTPLTIDKNEIAEAAWFSRGNLPQHSLNLSIAGEMIEKFEQGVL